MQMHQLDARIRRILQELKGLQVVRSIPLENIEIAPKGSGDRRPFTNGDTWTAEGEWWDFYAKATVPDTFTGRVVLAARTGREAGWEAINPQFIVRVNGRIEQAFDTRHMSILLQETAKPGETFAFELNGYCPATEKGQTLPVLELSLQDIDEDLVQLCYDIEVPYEAVLMLPPGDRERETTLETLARAIDLLDLRAPHSEAFASAVAAARAYLGEAYYTPRANLPPVAIAESVGHTHIDVAWLWDLYQTRYKAVRSFATVLKLMSQYPEYTFMSSQAALYNMVKQDAPELFERIQEAVREGRWEVEGGMWVEADCNLASGESLVRQFLYGQQFFIREFGKKSRILWLPDVFGYSAALPQIMKESGIDYFMTTKLSWSEFNMTPYDTFRWKGIDGTEILTHFSPSRDFTESGEAGPDGLPYFTTYNAMINPKQIAGGWQRYQQKGIDDHFLVSFGYGDGGGGPTDWMLENARRMQTPLPSVPVVKQTHARPFFEGLEARVAGDKRLPKWSGELYLEYHRGTYTAMARNKRDNRKIEFLLREVELWSAYAEKLGGAPYPGAQIESIWEDVLTLQFHDILPGSSIQKVYDDSEITYRQRFAEADALLSAAVSFIAGQMPGDVVAFNSLSNVRDDMVWFEAPETVAALRDGAGYLYPVQHVEGRACAFVQGLQPLTATPLWYVTEAPSMQAVQADQHGFDTPFFRGTFDKAMRITSLLDKRTGREVAKPGEALNRIVCYENKPHNYDAWDINIYYNRRFWEVDDVQDVQIVSQGPVLTKLRVTYAYMSSRIEQDIVLYHDIGRIDFETTADWREKQYLLKAHFPVDVFYNEATYDIQYGNIRRATHKNTSWDTARFEVCAHKWADVSEDGFGVSLLNDCKYGHSIDEDSMTLTLLKSSKHPNPIADLEVHHFTYALMPHADGWREAGTVDMGYQLNVPVLAMKGAAQEAKRLPPLVTVMDVPNVKIESIKKAQDGQGMIVRLYECYGRRTDVMLQLAAAPQAVHCCNMLEENGDALARSATVPLTFRPYEIVSLRIQ